MQENGGQRDQEADIIMFVHLNLTLACSGVQKKESNVHHESISLVKVLPVVAELLIATAGACFPSIISIW